MNAKLIDYGDGRNVHDVIQKIIDEGGGGTPGPQGPPGPPGPQGEKGDSGVEVFIASYGNTTAQEIIEYLDGGLEMPFYVERSGALYTVVTAAKQSESKVIIRTFATLSGKYYIFTYTITNGTWAAASNGIQEFLQSGVNIKSINGETLLGGGDLEIPDYKPNILSNHVDGTINAGERKNFVIPFGDLLEDGRVLCSLKKLQVTANPTSIRDNIVIQGFTTTSNSTAYQITLKNTGNESGDITVDLNVLAMVI